jgi:hypothetical protein
MLYAVPEETAADGTIPTRTGRIILSGGEVLVPQTRESVLYPAIDCIVEKYRSKGGVNVVVQTTGDLITEKIVNEMLARRVWMISVSGMDDFHEGLTPERRERVAAQTCWILVGFA